MTAVHMLKSEGEPPPGLCLPQKPGGELADIRVDRCFPAQRPDFRTVRVRRRFPRGLDEDTSVQGVQRGRDVRVVPLRGRVDIADKTDAIFDSRPELSRQLSPGGA